MANIDSLVGTADTLKEQRPSSRSTPDQGNQESLKIQEQLDTGKPCILVRRGDNLWKIVTDENVIAQFRKAGAGQLNPDQKIDSLIRLNSSLKENPSLIQPGQLIVLPENPFDRLERLNKKPVNPFDKLR